jgi:hypothetical protein
MHRCQVKIRHHRETPHDNLLECGDTANKKIGKIWVCNFHYDHFRVPDLGEAHFASCTDAVDASSSTLRTITIHELD